MDVLVRLVGNQCVRCCWKSAGRVLQASGEVGWSDGAVVVSTATCSVEGPGLASKLEQSFAYEASFTSSSPSSLRACSKPHRGQV
jgi:hypothetical protein